MTNLTTTANNATAETPFRQPQINTRVCQASRWTPDGPHRFTTRAGWRESCAKCSAQMFGAFVEDEVELVPVFDLWPNYNDIHRGRSPNEAIPVDPFIMRDILT